MGHVRSSLVVATIVGVALLGCTAKNNATDTHCGNGVVDPGEECDDGNLIATDDCLPDCTAARCGDGLVNSEGGEICDDGNNVSGDGCSADCRSAERCGNHVVDPGEICDDGNTIAGDGCSPDCLSDETCGNGIVDKAKGEVCDDANKVAGDGCSANCKSAEACGNGVVDSDLPNNAQNDVDCRTSTNEVHNCAEICDPPNEPGLPGYDNTKPLCSRNCLSKMTCGNGVIDVDVGEVCDPPGSNCSPDCRSGESCGNGIVDPGEQCDVGSFGDTPYCNGSGSGNAACHVAICGDGYVNTAAGEVCDDGNRDDSDDCTNACQPARCGDGILHYHGTGHEKCDDGNTANGDGCTSTCVYG